MLPCMLWRVKSLHFCVTASKKRDMYQLSKSRPLYVTLVNSLNIRTWFPHIYPSIPDSHDTEMTVATEIRLYYVKLWFEIPLKH